MFLDKAIRNVYPNAITIKYEDSTKAYDIDNNLIALDDALVDAEVIKLQAEYDNLQYQRDRKVEYDKLNQLELISDDAINNTTTHKDAILAIKAQCPKPI